MWNEIIVVNQRGSVAAKDFLPPSGDSSLLPRGVEELRNVENVEWHSHKYTQSEEYVLEKSS